MRPEALGFIRHARLMLQNAASKIGTEWDDPEVNLSPTQTEDMRREMRDCARLIKEIDPFVKAFEGVTSARRTTRVAVD